MYIRTDVLIFIEEKMKDRDHKKCTYKRLTGSMVLKSCTIKVYESDHKTYSFPQFLNKDPGTWHKTI